MKASARMVAAVGCIAGISGLALAQTTYTPPPVLGVPHGGPYRGAPAAGPKMSSPPTVLVVPHGGPYRGAPAAGPKMSLKDVPLHPLEARGVVPKLTHVGPRGNVIHALPTVKGAAARKHALRSAGFQPVLYNGGPIMNPYLAYYPIFWAPSTLQSGDATGFSALYVSVILKLSAWFPDHGLSNIMTQYYQNINGTTTYIANGGGLGGFYIDTSPYPASGSSCAGSGLTNCIDDTQIQAEITKVMGINGWTGGLDRMFLLFTSSGENSCFDTNICSYTYYCAYHGFFNLNGQPVIYGNEPYGDPNICNNIIQFPNDPYADTAATAASHEMSEAATDPLLNAWFDSSGNEIGDLCAYNYGINTWNNATANQMWNGFFFELQMEWDNHANSGAGDCSQVGPQQ